VRRPVVHYDEIEPADQWAAHREDAADALGHQVTLVIHRHDDGQMLRHRKTLHRSGASHQMTRTPPRVRRVAPLASRDERLVGPADPTTYRRSNQTQPLVPRPRGFPSRIPCTSLAPDQPRTSLCP